MIYFCRILSDIHEHNWHILQKYFIHQGFITFIILYLYFLRSKFPIINIKTASRNVLHSEKFSAFQNEIYYFHLPSGFQGRSSSTNNIWKLLRNLEYTRLPNLVKHGSTWRQNTVWFSDSWWWCSSSSSVKLVTWQIWGHNVPAQHWKLKRYKVYCVQDGSFCPCWLHGSILTT